MAIISIDDYRSQAFSEIFARDIEEHIEALKKTIREAQQDDEEPNDDEVKECDALIEFRDRAVAETGKDFEQVAIVPDDDFEDFLREQALENADVSVDLARHVNWSAVADEARATIDWRPIDFGDDLVYVR